MFFWDAESVDPFEIRWGPDPSCKGQFWGKGHVRACL